MSAGVEQSPPRRLLARIVPEAFAPAVLVGVVPVLNRAAHRAEPGRRSAVGEGGHSAAVSGPLSRVEVSRPRAGTSAVVLLLHGGQASSLRPAHRGRLTYLRMVPFRTALRRAGRDDGLAVWTLRYRYRGWNEPDVHPVADAQWALAEVERRHPGVPVVLVGHSMGGRTALRVADHPSVVAVCALAPWIEPGEPVDQLAGRTVLIAHGDQERVTDPAKSYDFAVRARAVTDRVCRFDVHGDGHAMLRRAADWTALVRRFVLGAVGIEPESPDITRALGEPAPDGLRVPLG